MPLLFFVLSEIGIKIARYINNIMYKRMDNASEQGWRPGVVLKNNGKGGEKRIKKEGIEVQ